MKKILTYLNLLLVTLLLASCQDFLDVNTDPNNPTVITPALTLPVAQNYTAQLMYNNRRISNLGNMFMYNHSQSDGFAWYPDEFKYLVTSSFYQNIFDASYVNCLKSYNLLAQQPAGKYDYYRAIGEIMKVYHYQLLVDMYGDVPYSEALQRSNNPTPKYDDASEIYANLIVKLTDAIAIINNAPVIIVTPGADDAMFAGNMLKWKQFANTLKLRILMRTSDMAIADRPFDIQAEINAIVAEGSGYITTDVGVNPGYMKGVDKQNPLWETFGADASGAITMNNKATCASDYVLKYLADRNDPRIDRIYEKPTSGHKGVVQGLLDYDTPVKDAFIPEKVSNIGPGILKSPSQPAIIFTLAESYFNQAEAAFKSYTGDDAKTLYQNGITASFTFLEVPTTLLLPTIPAVAAAYYNQAIDLVGWDASAGKEIEAIITQKWIATNGLTAEQSWFDYTRTGFPTGLPVPINQTHTDRPVRLYYTAGEISANGANVPSPQPDAFTAKVFWGN